MHHQHLKKPELTHDSDSEHSSAKQVHTERLNAQPVGIPLYLQRSQTHLLQRQPLAEEEEELQTKCENCAIHPQALEGEEKTLQEKSDYDAAPQHQQKEQALQTKTASHSLQAKLKIGAPNDKYEQEADRVADEVMRMPDSTVQRQTDDKEEEEPLQAKPLANTIAPLIQRQAEPEEEEEEPLQTKSIANTITPLIQRQPEPEEEEEEELVQTKSIANTITPLIQRQPEPEEEAEPEREEEEEPVQTKSIDNKSSSVTTGLQNQIQSLKGGGQPLPKSERAFLEPRFGADFSHVRLHSDSGAAHISRSINARAFTHGHDVVFGAGQYSPGTRSGRKLLAHELTHVVQQNSGSTLFSAAKYSQQTKPNSKQQSVVSQGSAGATSGSHIQRQFITPLAAGGGYGGLLERDRRRVFGRASLPLPWIDVRSGPAASVGFGGHGFDHLFIIETDTSANEFFYRGGIGNRCAGTSWPFYGISTDSGRYLPGTVDWHPGAPSVTVATGAAAVGKGPCFSSELARIRASCTTYNMFGPNSNTVVKTLLSNCGLPLRKPAGSWAPGWGHAPI